MEAGGRGGVGSMVAKGVKGVDGCVGDVDGGGLSMSIKFAPRLGVVELPVSAGLCVFANGEEFTMDVKMEVSMGVFEETGGV